MQEIEKQISIKDEMHVQNFFEQIDYFCKEKFDTDHSNKMPDFGFEKNNKQYLIICEVKHIFSYGHDSKGKRVSFFYDQKNEKDGYWHFVEPNFQKIHEKLEEASSQYTSLIKKRPEYRLTPYLVVLFDYAIMGYPDISDIESEDLKDYPNISAIAFMVNNFQISEKLKNKNSAEIKRYIEKGPRSKLQTQLKFVLNKKPNIKFKPQHFPGQIFL
ncbi:MAG: hypothetical protein M1429_02680 [Patescibacteria group bacterium]|nr:hypothetical protein [Patescibacteria group bacterium]